MPESRRRKRKHTASTGRQKIAALDGTMIRLRVCCRIELTLGHPRCVAAHDSDCRVPYDRSEKGRLARVLVMSAALDKLRGHGIDAVIVLDTAGSEPLLILR